MIEDNSRRAFEEWFEADAMPLEHSNWFAKNEDGDYKISHVDSSWEAWKAGVDWALKNNKDIPKLQPENYKEKKIPIWTTGD